MIYKITKASVLYLLSFHAFAEQGMWIPFEMDSSKMKQSGLEIPFEELFSNNDTSLKDAIVLFGGGCTGSFISPEGLLLTNHHCGYYYISNISDTIQNYIKNGFWANSLQDEIPMKSLTISIVKKFVNITDQVKKGLDKASQSSDSLFKNNIRNILEEEKKHARGNLTIKTTFKDQSYYLIELETFNDVRLVGAPPSVFANLGGDYDNWVFPRHSADFSIFRVYADSLNQPADYALNNRPYKPLKHLSVNIKEQKEEDFCFVYGFPAFTDEYLSSYGLNHEINSLSPIRIKLRKEYLSAIQDHMSKNESVLLTYTSQYNRISNYYKKMQGQVIGIKTFNALDYKKTTEDKLALLNVIIPGGFYDSLSLEYNRLDMYEKEFVYYRELMALSSVFRSFKALDDLYKNNVISSKKDTLWFNTHKSMEVFLSKDPMIKNIEKEVLIKLVKLYLQEDPTMVKQNIQEYINKKYKGSIEAMAEDIFINSVFFKSYNASSHRTKKMEKDPLVMLYNTFQKDRTLLDVKRKELNQKIDLYEQTHLNAFLAYNQTIQNKIFPDANGTLRLTYGHIRSYVNYNHEKINWFTDHFSLLGKLEANKGKIEYQMPQEYVSLLKNASLSKYAHHNLLKTCIISTNHTTGGNSGSPVLNSKGELMALNFDRSWESTMSDYHYEPTICRNISLTTNYLLFIIDQYANCQHIMRELTIIR